MKSDELAHNRSDSDSLPLPLNLKNSGVQDMTDSDSDELVWYLAYGSNLKMERFFKYIGKCRDSRRPRLDQNFKTRHQLYFAKNAPRWENKAVAFIRPTASDDFETLGRRFLISREQLEDILAQENGADSGDSRGVSMMRYLWRISQIELVA